MLTFEHDYWCQCPDGILAGVDEVGRGPLAGPVHAGAVIIPRSIIDELLQGALADLTDSKRLTAKSRERFLAFMEAHAGIRIGVGQATVEEIDRLNILVATHLAMRRAVLALGDPQPDHVLVDGLPVRGLPCPSRAIVKGDARSLLIAAASVAAKVVRDRVMCELDRSYPPYDFAGNKGYGTRKHLLALQQHGPTPVHRKTFQPVAGMLQPSLFQLEEP
jgi:ribonuclease HII